MFSKFYILYLLIIHITAQVRDLTPDDFDTVVDGSKNVFVKFYAPWCGHCKSFAPELDKVNDAFKDIDDVIIAKFDASAHREFARRFKVQGYPTLKFFPKGSTKPINYKGGRIADSVIKFINEKTGLNVKIIELPSIVTVLNSNNFDSIVLDANKSVLVEFYAPWCVHCKKLAPIWEKLAQVFEQDENVVIAKIDAVVNKELTLKYGIKSYPTIKYFPSGSNKQPEPYEKSKTLKQFVLFVNKKAGTRRNEDGSLKPTPKLNKTINEELRKACADEPSGKNCEYFEVLRLAEEKGMEYISKKL